MNTMSLLNALSDIRKLDENMTVRELEALLTIASHPGITVTEAAKVIGISASTMSRHLLDLGDLSRLGKPGLELVTRTPDKDDPRVLRIFLTDKGQALVSALA